MFTVACLQIALMFSDAAATISIPVEDFEEVPDITSLDENGKEIVMSDGFVMTQTDTLHAHLLVAAVVQFLSI